MDIIRTKELSKMSIVSCGRSAAEMKGNKKHLISCQEKQE